MGGEMMKPPSMAAGVALLLAIAVAFMATTTTTAEAVAACNPAQLTPCAGPALFGGPVPPACCAQLRAQQACLCGYARSPNYGSYIRSPNAARLFAVCRLPMPRCS
ncbi:probable non-specific lipid-transfer protein 2 [Phragmites australis]|uniref:probable non-specific lipid-transfer protein 2 n=1 Tax=Phragmites australis TaxID=29695 RepID=UPI002D7824D7|nr:probable non-specific lipid-transfer protein 2 [Phragmites australis]